MSKEKLPKTIFVMRQAHDDEEWLESAESVEKFAVIGETVMVGVYRLVKKQKIKGTVKIMKELVV